MLTIYLPDDSSIGHTKQPTGIHKTAAWAHGMFPKCDVWRRAIRVRSMMFVLPHALPVRKVKVDKTACVGFSVATRIVGSQKYTRIQT